MSKCLEGIRVVEFSTFVASSATGRMMAEMGADVIKVEPIKGDPWRFYFLPSPIEWNGDENPQWEIF